ncbi:hypothetical protein GOP47_0007582 [Adiantum capillus-veneris]|uniref:F-box domain-containing protein n=1 Tax=Adiantum capillus-veneris TaxID=13818 RepID=A0A9D4V163_ADICA|nr:hypothetical protein GOP47_0007582 [Adiantum capillus-veneris]
MSADLNVSVPSISILTYVCERTATLFDMELSIEMTEVLTGHILDRLGLPDLLSLRSVSRSMKTIIDGNTWMRKWSGRVGFLVTVGSHTLKLMGFLLESIHLLPIAMVLGDFSLSIRLFPSLGLQHYPLDVNRACSDGGLIGGFVVGSFQQVVVLHPWNLQSRHLPPLPSVAVGEEETWEVQLASLSSDDYYVIV